MANPCAAMVIAKFGATIGSTFCDLGCDCAPTGGQVVCNIAWSFVTSVLSCIGIAAAKVIDLKEPFDEIYELLVGSLAAVAGGTVGTAGAGLCGVFE